MFDFMISIKKNFKLKKMSKIIKLLFLWLGQTITEKFKITILINIKKTVSGFKFRPYKLGNGFYFFF